MAILKKDPVSPENLARLAQHFPQLDPSALDLMVHLLLTSAETERLMEKHFSEFKLSQGRFSALMMLYHTDSKQAKPIEIAEYLGVTRGNMTGILENLEKDKLICRATDPNDKRVNFVCLTKKGLKHLNHMLPQHLARSSRLVKKVSPADRIKMIELLTLIRGEAKRLLEELS